MPAAERRKNEGALSDFADYVQKQQANRRPLAPAKKQAAMIEEHDELDFLDTLDLTDESRAIRLKQVLLDTDATTEAESIKKLKEYVKGRINEEHGEFLFDLGLEDNGDSMGFGKDEWERSLKRMETVSHDLSADVKVLITRNVSVASKDNEIEVGPRDGKDTACSGKLMVRKRPGSVDDVIETRIAVVGNGMGILLMSRGRG
jgi:GTPase